MNSGIVGCLLLKKMKLNFWSPSALLQSLPSQQRNGASTKGKGRQKEGNKKSDGKEERERTK
jgi:hypothetical protein